MTNLQIILAVATIVLVIWQAFILAGAVALLSRGHSVKYGVGPGIVAVITGTALWMSLR